MSTDTLDLGAVPAEWTRRHLLGLEGLSAQEIVLILASMDDERPVDSRVCGTCGTEYIGLHCPRCHEARMRLRGR